MNQAEMENSLRALLVDRAQRAPLTEGLADQIIAQAETGIPVRQLHRPNVRRRGWALPLLAVAAVAAVVAGGIGYLTVNDTSSGHGDAPVAKGPTPSFSSSGVTTTPPPSNTSNTQLPVAGAYLSLRSTLNDGARLVHLTAFKALDLTFVGSNVWAMGSATCFKTGQGRCSLLVHSTDGVHWSMLKPTPFNVADDTTGCATVCVDHIRFATPKIGYLFGKDTLLMTTDAGRTWKPQTGGADALETLDGNVIRVSSSDGCPPGCTYTVQTSAIGSTTWKTVSLPTPATGVGVTLARTASSAYLMTYANPAGGAEKETSTLFTSSDDGSSWISRGEVCAQKPGPNGEVDSASMTGGSDGSIEVLCQPRKATTTDSSWVTVSTDGGKKFHASVGLLNAGQPGLVGAGTAQDFCVQGENQLSCTHDGGSTYSAAQAVGKGPKHALWLGFENQSDGRALEISSTGSNLWTTHDGGSTWKLTVDIG